jgi:hypothetical protein
MKTKMKTKSKKRIIKRKAQKKTKNRRSRQPNNRFQLLLVRINSLEKTNI